MDGSPDIEGVKTLKEMVAGSLATLSEAALIVDDMITEGEKVATRWTMTAIHSGEFMGIPPTGRRLTMYGIIIDNFVDDKIVEAWEAFDIFGLMKQLEMLPND